LLNKQKTTADAVLKINDQISLTDFISKILNKKNENKPKDKIITKNTLQNFRKLIIFENDVFFVINKPTGLAVQSGTKTEISVADFLQNGEKLVHRIDKSTSGLLIIAKNRESADCLSTFFKEKKDMEKIYLAVVFGRFNKQEGQINFPLLKKIENGIEKVYVDKGGKEAITLYKVLSYNEKYNLSLVECKILTGRTHQIRVHLKELGHPILGDGKYGGKKAFLSGTERERVSQNMHLHSYKLLLHNFKGEDYSLKADLPNHFVQTLKRSKLKKIT
ncbi:MAG: RluA family pseudouridine synthase, partial [Rickettsiales bacterium]|jgi:23S rRNA pseudouridine955/2504/2580 synthase|nr:RluA family pseudouridine synthase [Rickettsiales bacterium]